MRTFLTTYNEIKGLAAGKQQNISKNWNYGLRRDSETYLVPVILSTRKQDLKQDCSHTLTKLLNNNEDWSKTHHKNVCLTGM
jgi:hypothetical protein